MQVNIEAKPSYALAYCLLEVGESVLCDRGAMALMSDGVEAKGAIHGGMTRAFIRKQFGEENFFQARYTAAVHGAWVAVAPRFPGDITVLDLVEGQSILTESGAVLAHADSVEVDVKYAGLKNIALREGATALRLHGEGKVLISAYGGIQHFNLAPGESLVVDTGHLLAWAATCSLQVGVLGSVVTSQVTGEGLVGRLTGPGDVWIQTRAEQGIKEWLFPEREQNSGPRLFSGTGHH